MQPHRTASIALLGLALLVSPRVGLAGTPTNPEILALPGLSAPVLVTTDALGVPHVEAETDADVFRAQGYLHARDRFFQMDVNRRAASGTLAELTGSDLGNDFGVRPLGLRMAAQRSADLLTPRERAVFDAYAEGVNAYLAAHPLPPEYVQLEISSVPLWSPIDSLAIDAHLFARLAFASTPLDIGRTARLQSYVDVLGEAAGTALYFEDLARIAPMEPAATVPDATGTTPFLGGAAPSAATRRLATTSVASTRTLAPITGFPLPAALDDREAGLGSNIWGVAGSKSASGRPMVAYDPHLALTAPAFWYETHLVVRHDPHAGPMNVTGQSAPGLPTVPVGQNSNIAWGATSLQSDILDVFQDRLIRDDPSCPARLCIESAGELHPVEERSESYRFNLVGDGIFDNFVELPPSPDVLSVPFRSFGPILQIDDPSVVDGGPATETAVLTLQWSELHGVRRPHHTLNAQRAQDVFEFLESARFYSGQNTVVADASGNLAYLAGGEVPLRADLEAGSLVGSHPALVRDGSGPNNWIPDPERYQGQVIPYRVIPFDEMPQVVNPPAGFVVNANEDPSGAVLDNDSLNQFRPSNPQAIYYFGSYFLTSGLRNGRVTRLLREKIDADEKVSLDDMKRFQANTQQLDAELMTPFLLAAFENAQSPGAPSELAPFADDPAIVEAIGRLGDWDFSTPTGIPEGYDASDVDGVRNPDVSATEAADSVAATLYNVWRAKLIKNQVNASLAALGLVPSGGSGSLRLVHKLLSQDPFTGVGASGVSFFPEPAALAAENRRDVALLQALRDALDALASNAYAAAFGNSTDQDDYRWGRLHRVAFRHPLGGAASIPPAAGFTNLAADLAGISRDGGYGTVNRGGGGALADGANQFQFGSGASSRLVMSPGHPSAAGADALGFNSLAGGSSGDPTSPLYASQLGQWLTVDYHPVPMTPEDVAAAGERFESFEPLRFCLLEPTPGCTEGGKASLSVDERKPGKEKLTLRLQKLAAETTPSDLGDPVAGTTSYEICLYDEADARIARLRVDRAGQTCGGKGKPCWKARGAGLEYKDGDAAADGVKKLAARSGAAGKGKVHARAGNKAKRGQEALPVGIAAALEGAASARVQVLVSDAACFEATLATVKKADGAQFKAKTP